MKVHIILQVHRALHPHLHRHQAPIMPNLIPHHFHNDFAQVQFRA